MMYTSKLAVAVKSGGKVLREFGDIVYVPFNSEYSILIKNLNNVRALVKITIDGENVTDDGLVVNANSHIDLERFLGDLSIGHRFKFIKRTSKIEQHRGIGVEDGLIRIEFQFEKPARPIAWSTEYRSFLNTTNISGSDARIKSCSYSHDSYSVGAQSLSTNIDDVGITVKGSISDQKFVTVHMGEMEKETHVMVIKMVGETPQGEHVKKPVTVKTKQTCETCGHNNKATSKYCSECGTSLCVLT